MWDELPCEVLQRVLLLVEEGLTREDAEEGEGRPPSQALLQAALVCRGWARAFQRGDDGFWRAMCRARWPSSKQQPAAGPGPSTCAWWWRYSDRATGADLGEGVHVNIPLDRAFGNPRGRVRMSSVCLRDGGTVCGLVAGRVHVSINATSGAPPQVISFPAARTDGLVAIAAAPPPTTASSAQQVVTACNTWPGCRTASIHCWGFNLPQAGVNPSLASGSAWGLAAGGGLWAGGRQVGDAWRLWSESEDHDFTAVTLQRAGGLAAVAYAHQRGRDSAVHLHWIAEPPVGGGGGGGGQGGRSEGEGAASSVGMGAWAGARAPPPPRGRARRPLGDAGEVMSVPPSREELHVAPPPLAGGRARQEGPSPPPETDDVAAGRSSKGHSAGRRVTHAVRGRGAVCALALLPAPRGRGMDGMVMVAGTADARIIAWGAVAPPRHRSPGAALPTTSPQRPVGEQQNEGAGGGGEGAAEGETDTGRGVVSSLRPLVSKVLALKSHGRALLCVGEAAGGRTRVLLWNEATGSQALGPNNCVVMQAGSLIDACIVDDAVAAVGRSGTVRLFHRCSGGPLGPELFRHGSRVERAQIAPRARGERGFATVMVSSGRASLRVHMPRPPVVGGGAELLPVTCPACRQPASRDPSWEGSGRAAWVCAGCGNGEGAAGAGAGGGDMLVGFCDETVHAWKEGGGGAAEDMFVGWR